MKRRTFLAAVGGLVAAAVAPVMALARKKVPYTWETLKEAAGIDQRGWTRSVCFKVGDNVEWDGDSGQVCRGVVAEVSAERDRDRVTFLWVIALEGTWHGLTVGLLSHQLRMMSVRRWTLHRLDWQAAGENCPDLSCVQLV